MILLFDMPRMLFENNEAFMLKAIKRSDSAIQYASDALRNNEAFMLEALKRDLYLDIRYASDALKNNKEFLLKAVAITWHVLLRQAQRMTQFKDKTAKMGPEAANVGLFTYPVLMAADILLYQTDQVPVGEDQRQHLELTRDLAARFNSRYGESFVVPEPYILPSVGKIADLAEPGAKMSKSLSSPTGIIELLDEPAINIRKIKSAVTDSGREIIFDEIKKPGVSNLLTILSALTATPVDSLVEEFAGRGYGDLKNAVADAVTAFATPYRNRTLELMKERGELESILAKGADRAREVASATLADVYAKVGVA